ncbi:MAG: hypothetical protein GY874_14440 [Desulfobacteraceae bacterium]|nr:hypothetical protein [Desulfobacteraceae bacterium]
MKKPVQRCELRETAQRRGLQQQFFNAISLANLAKKEEKEEKKEGREEGKRDKTFKIIFPAYEDERAERAVWKLKPIGELERFMDPSLSFKTAPSMHRGNCRLLIRS